MPREFRDKNSNGRKEKKNMTCVRVCVGGGGVRVLIQCGCGRKKKVDLIKIRDTRFSFGFFFCGRTLLLLAGRSMAGIPSSRLRR